MLFSLQFMIDFSQGPKDEGYKMSISGGATLCKGKNTHNLDPISKLLGLIVV